MSEQYSPRYYDHLSRWTWNRGIDGSSTFPMSNVYVSNLLAAFNRRNPPELNHEHGSVPSRTSSSAATTLISPRSPSYNPESPESPDSSTTWRNPSMENRPPIYRESRSSYSYIPAVPRSDTASSAQPGRSSHTSQSVASQQPTPSINWILRVLGYREICRRGYGVVSEFFVEFTDYSPPHRAWDTLTAWMEQDLTERIAPREVQDFLNETRLECHRGLYGYMFTVRFAPNCGGTFTGCPMDGCIACGWGCH